MRKQNGSGVFGFSMVTVDSSVDLVRHDATFWFLFHEGIFTFYHEVGVP